MVKITIHTHDRTVTGSAKSWRSAVRQAYLRYGVNPADVLVIEERS